MPADTVGQRRGKLICCNLLSKTCVNCENSQKRKNILNAVASINNAAVSIIDFEQKSMSSLSTYIYYVFYKVTKS